MLSAEKIYITPTKCISLTRYFYSPIERPDVQLVEQIQQADKIITQVMIRALLVHQKEALLCLVSDIVAGLTDAPVGFEKSFLVTCLNKRMYQIAAAEFHGFCYHQGKVQTRLWEKRRAEAYLFSTGKLLF